MSEAPPIRLVVTDVDGTLVRSDKTLHPATIQAVASLRRAGVLFALVSSRPPQGLDVLLDPLGVDTPRAGFNGGLILSPANATLAELTIPEDACRMAVAHLEAAGAQAWVFSEGKWFLRDPDGPYVPREKLSISQDGTVVPDLRPHLSGVHKVMGVSEDFALMGRLEAELGTALNGRASVHRSQNYYLDVTHPEANKGHAALALAKLLEVEASAMCCLGDMPNDLPMFEVAGLSIAMGNAPESVRSRAMRITGDNEGTGWADAVRDFVLPSP